MWPVINRKVGVAKRLSSLNCASCELRCFTFDSVTFHPRLIARDDHCFMQTCAPFSAIALHFSHELWDICCRHKVQAAHDAGLESRAWKLFAARGHFSAAIMLLA